MPFWKWTMGILERLLSGIFAVLLFYPVRGESVRSWATLYPAVHFEQGGYCEAANAIDGRTNIGESGSNTVLNCASTKYPWPRHSRKWLQYLQIDLQRQYSIAAVTLHLRDGEDRQKWQNGLIVSVSNSTVDINQANAGTQCGAAYDAERFGQSPVFTCWNTGRYIYAILRDSPNPLQVCEMQIFTVMDLTAPGVATIFPDDVYEKEGKTALAANAVDGLSSIGDSGSDGVQNCAGLKRRGYRYLGIYRVQRRQLQYLRVDLGHSQLIHSIRLHLRDGKDKNFKYERYRDQNGMIVSISNSSRVSQSDSRCGLPYNGATHIQSPVFDCGLSARYVWMVLRNSYKPLLVCEVEVYADIRCTIPESPPNGNYITTRLTHGGSLTVSCKERFRPSSLHPVICQSSGNWSRPLPTCQELSCPNISNRIENGDLQISDLTVGSTANYTCNPEFRLQPDQGHRRALTLNCVQIQGSQTAKWDKLESTCIIDEKYCAIDHPRNGEAHRTRSRRVIFTCNIGYFLVGNKSLMCVDGAVFGKAPSCKVVECCTPPELANGFFEGKVFSYGNNIVYGCNSGYRLIGSNTYVCDANGRWSMTALPECEPVCSRPVIPSNVQAIGLGNHQQFSINSSITYECKFGYEMSQGKVSSSSDERPNTIESTCQLNRNWSTPAPSCFPVDCGIPDHPVNGMYRQTHGETTFGSRVAYLCKKQHYLVGSNSTRCQSNKEWSDPAPQCKPFCKYPKTISNGRSKRKTVNALKTLTWFDVNATVRYRCNRGYEFSKNSSHKRICQPDSLTWSGSLPSCKLVDCGQPLQPENGVINLTDTTFGSFVSFSCLTGYYLKGEKSAFCAANKRWSSNSTKCIPFCDRPEGVSNGRLEGIGNKNQIDVGDTVEYKCDDGYRLSSQMSSSRICQQHMKWSGRAPSCQLRDCGLPGELTNGQLTLTNMVSTYKSVATFSCKQGYYPRGSQFAVCKADGKWNVTFHQCMLFCERPKIAHGHVLVTGNRHEIIDVGSNATYECETGYWLLGSETRSCVGSRQWSGFAPTCEIVDCKTPTVSKDGYVRSTRSNIGSWAQYFCKDGYRLRGEEFVQCLATGKWSSVPPLCIPYCTMPSNPTNGQVTLTIALKRVPQFLSVGTSVTYSCKTGYILGGGANIRTCIGALAWPGKAPRCTVAYCPKPSSPDNGICTSNNTIYGGKRKCMCNHGFKFSDGSLTKEATCTVEKNVAIWSRPRPSCKEIICPSLRSNETFPGSNVVLQSRGKRLGDIASYRCAKCYEKASGNFERTCQRNDQWTGEPLQCKKKTCKALIDPYHGSLEGRKFDCGDSVSYSCDIGYVLQHGLERRTCECTGQWSGEEPICQPFHCTSCHKDAYCVSGVYCRCKPKYIGNGHFCCPRDMGGEVTIAGATGLLRCDRSCNVSFVRTTWYKNGSPLDLSQTRYGLASNGMLFYLEKVTPTDSGEYTCEMQVGETTYQRYCSLEVMESQSKSSPSCSLDCGRSCARKPFVARGVLTYAGQFPWQAMLCSPPQGQYCGGVLVSSDCIVTAAHCLVQGGAHIHNFSVCLGRQCGNCSEHDPEGNPQCFKPHSFAVHPQFDRRTFDNDIAVIKLRHSPSLDCTSVYPVCLPNKTRDGMYIRAHKQGIVTGWGRVNSTVSRSSCLRKGHVNLASRRICDMKHDKYPVTNSMMCATDYNGACEGDSGGPLVVPNRQYGDRYVLAGIVSWGIGCGKAKKLGVYTSVLSHLDWIKNTCGIDN